MKMKNFTFKTERTTGKYGHFFEPSYYIKYNKKVCGEIVKNSGLFAIRLQAIKTEEEKRLHPNCSWKWVQFTSRFVTLEEAKIWLNAHKEQVFRTIDLYKEDIN